MRDCEYLIRVYRVSHTGARCLDEVCSLVGKACLVSPPASPSCCTRREWALSYQNKHAPIPKAEIAPKSPGQPLSLPGVADGITQGDIRANGAS